MSICYSAIEMGKAKNTDPVVDKLAVIDARSFMLSQMINIGWRMAIMVIVPIFIGVQLDNKFDTKPSFTMTAFTLAMLGSGYLIYTTYLELQRNNIEPVKKLRKRINRRKNA